METALTDVRERDLPLIHRWLNSPESLGDFDETSFPTLEQLERKFKNAGYQTTWIIEVDGTPVGYANFARHPWDDWIACIGVIIADPAYRGKGGQWPNNDRGEYEIR